MVVDILSRLPVKSLMRFKCVCKFFYDLIKSDHHFMNKHYEISKGKTDCVVLEVGCFDREYYLLYKESEYNEIGCIYLDIVPGTPTSRVESWFKCCKGMLCLISIKDIRLNPDDYLIYDILIWNPSIRKVEALPSVTVPYRAPCHAYVDNHFGFGISNNMTWKVVMLLDISSSEDCSTIHQITMVYSKDQSGSWSLRQINSVISCKNISGDNDFYLKGRHYWRAKRSKRRYYDNYFINDEYLIWFDMNDEVFGTIELPSNLFIASVTIMNENIALLEENSENSECIDIWLMIENDNNTNWRKQVSIDCAQLNMYNKIEYNTWNVDGELLVFLDCHPAELEQEHVGVPYFASLDLVTQERKIFSLSKERKSITMASNSTTGHFQQVYNERNIDIIEEWKHNNFWHPDLGTIYSVTVPVRRVRSEYQLDDPTGTITNVEYKDTGEDSGSVDVKFDFYIPG
ncbi:putative F-box protein At1g70960 [Ipomoea triloba]|uniref:putative F-box protein At1g70960 n=1 Tax=Ipomoea triloba TaxID=35885 RepID=UPI00125E2EB3|nr:putative F-box protein At1g70960 [Ipomoea triloba]